MKNLLILFVLIISLNSQADFHSTYVIYKSGDYAKAHLEFLRMAKLGDKRSQFNIGVMYYNGQYVEKNIHKAYAWIKLANQSETNQVNQESALQLIANEIKDKTLAESEFKQLDALYSLEVLMDKLYPVLVKPEGKNAFQTMPETFVEPRWPRKALMRGIQGNVQLSFNIDKSGAARNIVVKSSFPKKLFNKASIEAIQQWRFKRSDMSSDMLSSNKRVDFKLLFRITDASKLAIKDRTYNETELAANNGDAIAQFKIGYWDKTFHRSRSGLNPNQWFLKSAIQGLPEAQYELGLSLIKGTGCLVDKSKGLDWLITAAASGEDSAKLLLASIAAEMNNLASHLRAVQYFSEAKKLTPAARLDYAWLLATSPYSEIKAPNKAIKLSGGFSRYQFRDDATLYEIKAAAYAAMGNFKKAISYQEDALEEAEDMNVDLDDIKSHLASYQKKEKWF